MKKAWLIGGVTGLATMALSDSIPAGLIVTITTTIVFTVLPGPRPEVASDDRTDEDRALANNQCPDCGSSDIYAGPAGGLCMNVLCDACDSEFNVALLPNGPHLIDRLGKCSESRKANIYGA